MQAVVKTPHTEIKIKGYIPKKILTALRNEYGKKVKVTPEKDDELVNVFETEWYKKIKKTTTPGDNMRIYRELRGMTQIELGEKLGKVHRQHISNMERGIRAISKKTAKQLAEIFDVSVEKFI